MALINANELAKSYKLTTLKKIPAKDINNTDLMEISIERENPKYYKTSAIEVGEYAKRIADYISKDEHDARIVDGIAIIDEGKIFRENPLKALSINITAVQEGSGVPSPENEIPIRGWTGANIYTRGFNLWDEEHRNGYYSVSTGDFMPQASTMANANPIKVVPNATYYCYSGSYNILASLYDANMNYIQQKNITNATFTIPPNCYYINFSNNFNTGATYNNDICINISSSENGTYKPYYSNSKTINIDWQDEAGTIYGATLNVKTGELIVTHIVDNRPQDLPWGGYQYVEGVFTAVIDNKKIGRTNIISNKLKTYDGSVTNMPDLNFLGANNSSRVYVRFDKYISNFSGFKTEIANGYVFVYELATPITYQLTPVQVMAIVGQNNIFANCGDVTECKYTMI